MNLKALICLILWPSAAFAVSPTLDCGSGSCPTGQFQGGSTSGTATLSTTNTNVLACVLLDTETQGPASGAAPKISSITDTASNTWKNYPQVGWPHQVNWAADVSGNFPRQDMDFWCTTSTAALSSDVITVHINTASDATAFLAFGVHGANSLTTPWDPTTCPAYNDFNQPGSTATPQITFSTGNADDLLIELVVVENGASMGVPSGWTTIASVINSSGVHYYANASAFYKSVSATQSAVNISNGTFPGDWQAAVVAVTADAGGTGTCSATSPGVLFHAPW